MSDQEREKFRRAVSRLMDAHGEWCYWRRTVPEAERERLAEIATAAERTVMELFDAAQACASSLPSSITEALNSGDGVYRP